MLVRITRTSKTEFDPTTHVVGQMVLQVQLYDPQIAEHASVKTVVSAPFFDRAGRHRAGTHQILHITAVVGGGVRFKYFPRRGGGKAGWNQDRYSSMTPLKIGGSLGKKKEQQKGRDGHGCY